MPVINCTHQLPGQLVEETTSIDRVSYIRVMSAADIGDWAVIRCETTFVYREWDTGPATQQFDRLTDTPRYQHTWRSSPIRIFNTTGNKSVILGKLLYAVSAWWGFSSAADRQRLQALLHRGIRSGLCSSETPSLTELAESIDDTLFERILHNPYHVIYHLLPLRRELSYNTRQRHHDRQLNIISGQLRSRNFIYRMLFNDCY